MDADSLDMEEVRRQQPSSVWVHVYHTDIYTAWLNWAWLKYAEIPIYHVGVEIYGEEWTFNYFDDTWDDPTVSGVINCQPRNMPGFEYQWSVCLGKTELTDDEVDLLLERLRSDWPANSYHLTRKNCLNFAEFFVNLLNPPEPFPPILLGVQEASKNNPVHEGVIDHGWGWAKWWMRRKYSQSESSGAPSQDPPVLLQQQLPQPLLTPGSHTTASSQSGETASVPGLPEHS